MGSNNCQKSYYHNRNINNNSNETLKAMSHLPAIYFEFGFGFRLGVSFAFASCTSSFHFLFYFIVNFNYLCIFLCGSHLATNRRNSTETTRCDLFRLSIVVADGATLPAAAVVVAVIVKLMLLLLLQLLLRLPQFDL